MAIRKPGELVACYPDQCCADGYCVDELWLHGVERDVAEHVIAYFRAQKAEAWDEGSHRGYALYTERMDYVRRENPYRDEDAHAACDQTRCCKAHSVHSDPHRGCMLR